MMRFRHFSGPISPSAPLRSGPLSSFCALALVACGGATLDVLHDTGDASPAPQPTTPHPESTAPITLPSTVDCTSIHSGSAYALSPGTLLDPVSDGHHVYFLEMTTFGNETSLGHLRRVAREGTASTAQNLEDVTELASRGSLGLSVDEQRYYVWTAYPSSMAVRYGSKATARTTGELIFHEADTSARGRLTVGQLVPRMGLGAVWHNASSVYELGVPPLELGAGIVAQPDTLGMGTKRIIGATSTTGFMLFSSSAIAGTSSVVAVPLDAGTARPVTRLSGIDFMQTAVSNGYDIYYAVAQLGSAQSLVYRLRSSSMTPERIGSTAYPAREIVVVGSDVYVREEMPLDCPSGMSGGCLPFRETLHRIDVSSPTFASVTVGTWDTGNLGAEHHMVTADECAAYWVAPNELRRVAR